MAHEARSVALSFVNGVAGGWGKAELAAWLAGPYARSVRHAARPPYEQGGPVRQSDHVVDLSASPLGADEVATLLRDARWRVLAGLESASAKTVDVSYAGAALTRGLIVPCLDEGGRHGYAAAPTSNMRLHQRVLALFAVDRLMNPMLHRDALFVCSRCERVVVDEASKARGVCTSHGPTAQMPAIDGRTYSRSDVGRTTRPYAYPALEHMGRKPAA